MCLLCGGGGSLGVSGATRNPRGLRNWIRKTALLISFSELRAVEMKLVNESGSAGMVSGGYAGTLVKDCVFRMTGVFHPFNIVVGSVGNPGSALWNARYERFRQKCCQPSLSFVWRQRGINWLVCRYAS